MKVIFKYYSGIKREFIKKATLAGSWDKEGNYSDKWSNIKMESTHSHYGDQCFECEMDFPDSSEGQTFTWGVFLDVDRASNLWGIASDANCSFVLNHSSSKNSTQTEEYFLTNYFRLGANKFFIKNKLAPAIIFSVWAPNAKNVELVFGNKTTGYIADDGQGLKQIHYPLFKNQKGIWSTDPTIPEFEYFAKLINEPYMFKITKDDGNIAYRTDLYSRAQIGEGDFDPKGAHYSKNFHQLAGTKSCSLVTDIDSSIPIYKSPENDLNNLIIYELHIGALGYGKNRPGNIDDAIKLLDYLEELGINAIELLPINEFQGKVGWGYGISHFFAIEQSAGGREKLKEFINECHKRKMSVIVDLVFNHYHHDSERAQWAYDSNAAEKNIYYWYEGVPSDYKIDSGGYIDNMSTGYSPRFCEDMVRKMLISSAVMFVEEFKVDGFRFDQTTSIHSYNVLHEDGKVMGNVNVSGAGFLRELVKTIRAINNKVLLIAEDHSNWDNVIKNVYEGGLGFDAIWYADFYHHLIGDQKKGDDYAKLIKNAGFGFNGSLNMNYFAGALGSTYNHRIVYNESHDEAGNSEESARTICIAVNNAALLGDTRKFAEARCRFAAGMTILSAGTPMFFMGEEIGAQKKYTHNTFIDNREDLYKTKKTTGKNLFNFYKELISLKKKTSCLNSNNIEIIYSNNENRVLAFRRWNDKNEVIIVASLNNRPFYNGYCLSFREGKWKGIFNSDSEFFGGDNVGNYGSVFETSNGTVNIILPANGFIVFGQS